jgi:hypothetical protein
MSQSSYTRAPELGYVGDVAEGLSIRELSRQAGEDLNFGDPVIESKDGSTVYKPLQDVLVITLDADLVTSNSFDGSFQVKSPNDSSFTEVDLDAVVYATSHDNTMDLIKAEIETQMSAYIDSAADVALTDATDNRQITVTLSDGYMVQEGATAFAVTLGASQAGIVLTSDMSKEIIGYVLFKHRQNKTLNTESAYWDRYDTVPVSKQAILWQKPAEASNTTDSVYVDFTPANRGKIRVAAGSVAKLVAGSKFRGQADADALNKIESNLP